MRKMMQKELELPKSCGTYEELSIMMPKELEVLKSCSTYKELLSAENWPNLNTLCDSEKHEEWDPDYNKWLSILFTEAKLEHHGKRKVVDDDASDHDDEYKNDDEDLDLQYELALSCLRESGNSYELEVVENGLPVFAKYEEEDEMDAERECDPEPRTMILRSSLKRGQESLDRSSSLGQVKETPAHRKSLKQAESNESMIENCLNDPTVEPGYLKFLKSCTFVGHGITSTLGGRTIVYEKSSVEDDQKQGDRDESDSDVEITDGISFYEDEFRREVLTLLRKPYNEEEYHRLMRDFEIRKPVLKHKDLHGGREMFVPLDKIGKSHLDQNPDLKRKLETTDDCPTRLNLLRGFFFHIQHLPHDGIFPPWQDAECLSVKPGSC